ncbi:MAG: AAA family ATPase [Cyanobacteria bacterium SZAS TMP-1]|nr:AAA family ATPase [Cyanobacteria bacterium SZAS TMP-1]
MSLFNRKKPVRQKIVEHMGKDPAGLPILSEQFEGHNHPNLHLALEEMGKTDGRTTSLIGIQGGFLSFTGTSLADLVAPKTMASFVGLGQAKEGPVQYSNIALEGDKRLACVQGALYLVKGEKRIVILMRPKGAEFGGATGTILLDVMAEERETAEAVIAELRNLINKHNIYRGKILSIDRKDNPVGTASTGIKFHTVPPVERSNIILPEGLLKRIERQTVEVTQYSDALRKAQRKMKRGILLHGKPGTGKTLTAMYLASAMKERTVLVLTGRGLGLIESSCELARWLQPSMVIIEDVDLIAEDRIQNSGGNSAVLFELLNQMDGLSDDADVLFMLTTNRPEILEPALASRPGRIDQAYEIPLPDAECRKRLFELYSQGLNVEVDNMDLFIKRTAGASGAFISELMRKAALFAAPEGDPIVVKAQHIDEALHELVIVGGTLTKSLLGFKEIGFSAVELGSSK